MTVQEGDRNKQWALRSLLTLPMQGPKSPSAFVSALSGGFDAGEKSNYVSVMLRYPYGPYMRIACERLGATVFSAADDDERLRYIGNNYQMRRYPFETGASFETRCGLAWDFHGEGGTSIAVRKALEAYGFVSIEILEECYYELTPDGADYQWAHTTILGPNYGDLPIDPMVLGSWVLGEDALGTGTFGSAQIDDVVRLILDQRQVHDAPWRLLFIFGNPWILGLTPLGGAPMGPSVGNGYAVREIRNRCALGVWVLGSTSFAGFGV